MKRLPIGISDFRKLVENEYYFVDTTQMIADVYRESSDIVLLTRPRRFGKTLNMSMLSYFYDHHLESASLFQDLSISQNSEVMAAMNSLPTIFISFKDIKDRYWNDALSQLKNLFSKLYGSFEKELASVFQNDMEKQVYQAIIYKTADLADYKASLKNLTEYLNRAYQKPVLLLIDEYDVPIQSGWTHGYYDDVIDFMQGLLSGALKDNSHLFKGVLTGIYRVAKESIFSGLNNLKVYTVLHEKYAQYFGFTQEEVDKLVEGLEDINVEKVKNDLRSWYNGYNFGGKTIYNPWSVVNYLSDGYLQPYWINTSSNNLIIEQIEKNMLVDESFRLSVEELLSGKTVKKRLDDASALRELAYDPDSIWTLFLFSGYLKAENKWYNEKTEEYFYDCSIPNTEVLRFYKKTVIHWLQKPARNILYDLADPLITGDGEKFCEKLKKFVMNTLSFYDLKGEPENTYHMILLGMFAHLTGGFWIKSNRESGKGRFDICLKAKDRNDFSAIIEIKPKGTEKAAQDGMEQIEEKIYVQELLSEGYSNILKISLAVDGKDVVAIVE